jgi:5-methylthioribose kinase
MPKRSDVLFCLSVENILAYLATVGRGVPFSIRQIIKVEEVSKYGNNNFIFRLTVRTWPRFYYLKQAQAFNRRSLQQGKPIAVEPSRMAGEVSLLRHLKKLWGPGIVPEVFFYDHSNAIMLMSDVGSGGKLLVEEFERERVHPELGRTMGRLLGKLHATTYGRPRRMVSSRAWQDRITKWLFGIQATRVVTGQA